jgi:hypothetical protein
MQAWQYQHDGWQRFTKEMKNKFLATLPIIIEIKTTVNPVELARRL